MGERLVGYGYGLPVLANRGDRALQVDRVPEHDGGDHEVQPTCAMPLVLVRAIPQFAQPVEEHRPCQGVSRLPLIQPDVDAAPQFDAADVLQEQCPFNLAEFAQRDGQPVLTWVSSCEQTIVFGHPGIACHTPEKPRISTPDRKGGFGQRGKPAAWAYTLGCPRTTRRGLTEPRSCRQSGIDIRI